MKNLLRHRSVFAVALIAFALTLFPIEWERGGVQLTSVQAAVPEETSDAPEGAEFRADDPQLLEVMAIQDSYTDELLTAPGIVGTATGVTKDGQLAVVVYAESYASAKAAAIPEELNEIPVVVEVTGKFVSLEKMALPRQGGDDRWPRPVPIGVSTGHPNITAGTIGCRVTDGEKLYALSNNHVYADENQASLGDPVLQPGTYDGGTDPGDRIGALADFEPIDFSPLHTNVIDAAIAESTDLVLDNATPPYCYGTPRSNPLDARLRMRVMKCGRTTEFTKGTISGINATVTVGYQTGSARFVDQIVITPGEFSAGGDSGSLIVKAGLFGRGRPVGLLFAGSSTHTLANPIRDVLDRFGITVDGR